MSLSESEAPDDVGTLTRIGCIGPFELASTDQADAEAVLYLLTTGADAERPGLPLRGRADVRDRVPGHGTAASRHHGRPALSGGTGLATVGLLQHVRHPLRPGPSDPAPEVIYGLDVSDRSSATPSVSTGCRMTRQPPEELTAAAEAGRAQPGSHDQRAVVRPGRRLHAERNDEKWVHDPVRNDHRGDAGNAARSRPASG